MFYIQLAKNIYLKLTTYLKQQMQLLLKKLIKDIIAFLLNLNVNIYILISNMAEKKII